jgi:hypothetical protein
MKTIANGSRAMVSVESKASLAGRARLPLMGFRYCSAMSVL